MSANDQPDHVEAWVSNDMGFAHLRGDIHAYSFFIHVDGHPDLALRIPRAKDGSVLRIEATWGTSSAQAEPSAMAGGASALQELIPAQNADVLRSALAMTRLVPTSTKGLDSLQVMSAGILGHMYAPYQPRVQTEWPWDYAAYATCYWACVAGGGGGSQWVTCGDDCRARYLGN